MSSSAVYPPIPHCILVVSGLPSWLSPVDVQHLLSQCGPFIDYRLQLERGVVIVRYAQIQQAQQAQAGISSWYQSEPSFSPSVALTTQLVDDEMLRLLQHSLPQPDISHSSQLCSQPAAFITPMRPPAPGQLSFPPMNTAHSFPPPTSSPSSPWYPLPPHPAAAYDPLASHSIAPLIYSAPSSLALSPHLDPALICTPFYSSAAAAAFPSSSSSSFSSLWPVLSRVSWEVIESDSHQQLYHMHVSGWKQFEDGVRTQLGARDVKVYHSFTVRSKVRVDSEAEFETAVRRQLKLSVWVCRPGKPSPPLYVDTSSPAVAEHRHVPPAMDPIPMASLGTPPSTARVPSTTPSSTPSSSRRSRHRKSPSSESSPGSSSPVSSHDKTMAGRVKKRDGVCVFTHVTPLVNENDNCHILAASPLERRVDGEWWQKHRERMVKEDGYDGHLDDYVVSMDKYAAERAPLGFHKPEGGPTHVIALFLDRRHESREHQYAVEMGLYAHHQFDAALGKGRVKLEIVRKQDRAQDDLLDFAVRWTMQTQLWELHFKGRGFASEQADSTLRPYPREGWLKQPLTEEGQKQWPARLIFELYSMVWYPFCRWKDEQDANKRREKAAE